jgi:glycosyltransferase involved in cell wall biosynthesis
MHFFGLDVVLLALAARRAGVRAITTKAGNPAPSRQQAPLQALKWAIVVMLLRALRVPIVSSSAWIQTSLERIARLPAGSCVIHNGTSYGVIDAAARMARSMRPADPTFVIGTLARLERIKDIPTLLRALALFKVAKPDASWRLEIAGDGPLRADLERMSRDLGLHDQVAFLGLRQDVYRLLGSWDLFLFSTTRDEGFGIVLVEAMAAGLEILASDVPACREVLGDGAFGKLFPSGNAEALADAISRAYDAREASGPSARGRESFDISVCASRHLALIQYLAGSRG